MDMMAHSSLRAQSWGALQAPAKPSALPLLPPQPPQARHKKWRRGGVAGSIHCSQYGPQQPNARIQQQQQHQQDSLMLLTLKATMLVTAANAVAACMPSAAQAAGWRPRRHLQQRLQQKHATEEPAEHVAARKAAQRQKAAQARKAEQQAATSGLQRMMESVQNGWRRLRGERPVYSVSISNRQQAYSSGQPPSPSAFGWVPLAIAAGAAVLLVFGRNIRWPSKREGQGGRWVRDRSLGGKDVFIPDQPGSSGPKQPRPLWEDDGSDLTATKLAAAAGGSAAAAAGPWATVTAASKSGAAPAGASSAARPEWWNEPSFLVYTPASRKEELQQQARAMLRMMEDGKLLQGLDYPISGLVSLRTLCQEAGGYQVKPKTEAGRDAILRAGVRAAISAAQEGRNTLIGGDEPSRFVCGLAHDLGVPERRTVTIVHAEVAAVCRAALIDAEAAYRAQNQADILLALLKLATTLQTFPLPPGSAEAELIAAGVVKQTSLEFRKALFFEFGAVSPPLAALVSEMLGFDPQLVMPQLMLQMQAAQQAEAMQQQQAEQAAAADQGQQ